MPKADVSDAFRSVRIAQDQAQNFGYVLGDVLVADPRLTFGSAGSPGFWGLVSAAAAYAHCNTSLTDAVMLPKGIAMMFHARITEPWEVGKPNKPPARPGFDRQREGGSWTRFLPRYPLTITSWRECYRIRMIVPR